MLHDDSISCMDINPSIFRAYDIRGSYPDEVNEAAAYRIGRAYINYLRNNPVLTGPLTVVVTADARTSSPALKEELIKGMCDEDANLTVIDGGLSTTPMHYFAINHAHADGGVMVTASHNPKAYNGFKLSRKGAVSIFQGGGMEEIKNTAVRGIFETTNTHGRVEKEDFLSAYVDFLLSYRDTAAFKKFSIVADTGNGMVGLILAELVKRLPVDIEIMYGEVDMTFPNHEANPIKDETLGELKARIQKADADFGIAFDGDGDRISFITHTGERVPSDYVLALLAEGEREARGAHDSFTVIYDLRTGRAVRDHLARMGVNGVESRVGRSFIKDTMRAQNAALAGELSGHYFFKDFWYSDSALITILRMLDFLSRQKKSLAELIAPFDIYARSGEINLEVADRDRAIDAIAAHYHDGKPQYLDGLSIEYPDVWFNVRPSNTELVIRLVAEARSKEILDETVADILEIVKK